VPAGPFDTPNGGRASRFALPVKLHSPASSSYYNTFTAYGVGYVEINQKRFESSLIVMPEGAVQPWAVEAFAQLGQAHFESLVALEPELVIFGSGAALRFVKPALLAPLMQSRIGVETMDTHAACRTYNILMSEGRRVACAILIEAAGGGS